MSIEPARQCHIAREDFGQLINLDFLETEFAVKRNAVLPFRAQIADARPFKRLELDVRKRHGVTRPNAFGGRNRHGHRRANRQHHRAIAKFDVPVASRGNAFRRFAGTQFERPLAIACTHRGTNDFAGLVETQIGVERIKRETLDVESYATQRHLADFHAGATTFGIDPLGCALQGFRGDGDVRQLQGINAETIAIQRPDIHIGPAAACLRVERFAERDLIQFYVRPRKQADAHAGRRHIIVNPRGKRFFESRVNAAEWNDVNRDEADHQ